MKVYKLFMISVVLIGQIMASGNPAPFIHLTPQGTVKGENVTFEVMLAPENSGMYDLYLLYRQLGEQEYKSVPMNQEGYIFDVTLRTNDFSTGQVEYYIAYEGQLGAVGTIPEESPQINPLIMLVAPNNTEQSPENNVEILVLSPEPDEMVRFDELLISASVMGLDEKFDYSKSKLLIDGTNVSSLAEVRDGIYTFSPKQIRSGYHNIELIIVDNMNNELGRQEWSFRATGGQDTSPESGARYAGSVFVENRYTQITNRGQNYLRAGGMFRGGYNALQYNARLAVSSEENSQRQPVNRYGLQLVYKISERNNVFLRGGDFSPYYNPLVFQNKRVRGIETGLAIGFFTFDFVYGQLYRGIGGRAITDSINTETQAPDGTPVDTTIYTQIVSAGKNEERIMAFRPGFRFGETAHWNLNLVSSREQKGSVEYGGPVQEALVMGTDLSMNFDNRRILFDASIQASINNTNAGNDEITYDELALGSEELRNNETAKKYWNFIEGLGMISMTTGLNPYPSLGMRFEASFRYFGNNFIARYTNVEQNFASPGNPYLLKDVSGIYIADNIRLLSNQVFLNLFYRGFSTNRSKKSLKTQNNEIGATVSYFPTGNLPSLTLSYINIDRSNDVDLNSGEFENPKLYLEDNKTQTFNVSTSYNFDLSSVRNTLSLNFSNYARDEAQEFKQGNQSNFSVYGIGVMSKFNFPLITRLNYSQSNSGIGAGLTESTTDIQRIFLGFEYNISGFMGADVFKPFVNFSLQNISFTGGNDTKRNNYTAGLSYRSPVFGILSIRYDNISYGTTTEYNDSIMNARYQYNF